MKTILVTGVTGKQGGAIAKNLLQRGHKVRGLTRNPSSPAAKALEGVELHKGDLTDRASLDAAMKGADAVFSMGTPFESGIETETKQGITVADAAKAAGAYLVYTSVGSADKKTGIPHFDSKYEVEKHIKSIGVKHAIIAPVYFMENIYFAMDALKNAVYAMPLTQRRKLAQIAVADIAAVGAAVLESPEKYAGSRHDLAGDDVSGDDALAVLSKVTGRTFSYFQVPMDVIRQRMGDDGAKMYEWFETTGYSFDRSVLAREFPDVKWHSFEDWAKTQTWSAILG